MNRASVKESAARAYAELADLAHTWTASRERGELDELGMGDRIVSTLAAIRELELCAELLADGAPREGGEVRQ